MSNQRQAASHKPPRQIDHETLGGWPNPDQPGVPKFADREMHHWVIARTDERSRLLKLGTNLTPYTVLWGANEQLWYTCHGPMPPEALARATSYIEPIPWPAGYSVRPALEQRAADVAHEAVRQAGPKADTP